MNPALNIIDGILLLNKPLNMSSNQVLQRVKRLFNAKKAGHTGSLDPLATGMLPICFGKATKISQFLLDSDKHYEVEATLGMTTTTGDAEGEIIETKSTEHIKVPCVQEALEKFKGRIEQTPPMFSALKYKGKPLYALARQGIEVERKPRTITIYSSRFIHYENNKLQFSVHCSKGTYIRTLVEDIGKYLGPGAYLSGLHRSAISPYPKNNMHTLTELQTLFEQQGVDGLLSYLLPIDSSVQHLPEIHLTPSQTFYVQRGEGVMGFSFPSGTWIRLFSSEGKFIGIGETVAEGRILPRRLI